MRFFLALPLSHDWLKTFEHYRDAHSDIGYLRWTPLGDLHVTALYLGEVENAVLPEILEGAQEIAQKTSALDIDFLRIQYAPPKTRARMVWAYLDPHPKYVEMIERLAKTMAEIPAGLEDLKSLLLAKGADVTPHITLARFKNDRPYPRELYRLHRTGREGKSLAFRELSLYQCRLGSTRPAYDVVDTFIFKD